MRHVVGHGERVVEGVAVITSGEAVAADAVGGQHQRMEPSAPRAAVTTHADADVDVDVLVVGAGVSGLGTAAFLQARGHVGRVVVVEAASEPGGYCRTVQQDGFTFDYAGHFFHFRDPSIHAFITERLPAGDEHALVEVVRRASVIDVDGHEVPYPYQGHLRTLPTDAARRCLVDLWHAERALDVDDDAPSSFQAWLRRRYGRGLCERFLEPYNAKLYGDLAALDATCMGRFFPDARFADVMAATAGRAWGYNATFTYPRRGAVTYIDALRRDLDPKDLWLGEPVVAVDLDAHVARTPSRRVRYRHLVMTGPLPQTLRLTGLAHDPTVFSASRVLVFNLGFDRRSAHDDVHWRYVARADVPFYRVGSYSAIAGGDRMSLYVEVGLGVDGAVDVSANQGAVLRGLRDIGVVRDERFVSGHHVVMDPAYVHLTPRGMAATTAARTTLASHGVHAIGRYGAWTYCSIEDNLLAARALADEIAVRAS